MRILVTALLAGALFAAPALAQTVAPGAADPGGTPAPEATTPAAEQPVAETTEAPAGSGSMAASQDRVTAALASSGYTEVEVLGTAYVIRARTPEGETVTMVVEADGADGASGASAEGSATPGAPTSIDNSLGDDAGTANDLSEPTEANPAAPVPGTAPGGNAN